MRPDGRLNETSCSLVVLHNSVSRRKPYLNYELILAWLQKAVKEHFASFDIFYDLTTNPLGFYWVFVQQNNRGVQDYFTTFLASQ